MNREIKFRGKCERSDEWCYGSLVDYGYDEMPEIQGFDVFREGNDNWKEIKVIPETVGQFTGLHDKNGKEIYEGDLIKSPSGLVYTVIFGTWVHDEKKEFPKIIDKYEHTGWCISLDGNTPCELLDSEVCSGVIAGNVHDNPELLKVNSAGNISPTKNNG